MSKNKEETPILTLSKQYPKLCRKNQIQIYKQFQEVIKQNLEDDTQLITLHLWDESNEDSVKNIFEAMQISKINTLKSIRLWKIKTGDKGIEGLEKYLKEFNQVEILDLLDNNITSLGCQKIQSALIQPNFLIKKLMLDHNPIKSEGLKFIIEGLRKNKFLEELSLSYCLLDEKSCEYLQQILMYVNSKLKKINLQGNLIKQSGFFQLLRPLQYNTVLQELNIADNQIVDDEEMIKFLIEILDQNKTLKNLDLSFNRIYQNSASLILNLQKDKKQTKVDLSDRFDQEFTIQYNTFMTKLSKMKKGKGKKRKTNS